MKSPERERYDTILSELIQIAFSRGVFLRIGKDVEEFKTIAKSIDEKGSVNPAFDPQYSDVSEHNVIWMTGHDRTGDVIHTQAIKLIDLTKTTLERHLTTDLEDYRSGGYDFDLGKTQKFLSPGAAEISGWITYHGELWIKGGPNGFRGGCMAIILTRIMLLVGLLRWSPDFMIGLQSPMTSCRGLAVREGYMRMEQRSIVWQQKHSDELMEDWLVWMSRDEALFNLRVEPRLFVDLFEKQPSAAAANSGQMSKVA